MTKKIHERVLLDNGQFGHFPQRHLDKAVELGNREPIDPIIPEPQISHGKHGKAEIESKNKKQKAIQDKKKI